MDSIYKILKPLFDEYKVNERTHYEIDVNEIYFYYKGKKVYEFFQWKDNEELLLIFGDGRDAINLMDVDHDDFNPHHLINFIFEVSNGHK